MSTKSFKEFLKVSSKVAITEAIQPHHQKLADKYQQYSALDDETINRMESSFTHGPSHSVVDLHNGKSVADADVSEHLREHGWKIHDYQKGLASKTTMVGNPERGIPMREKLVHKNIGKILEETDAPSVVKSSYQNDPERSTKGAGGLKVLISTHPYATVGKTSGTKWSQESCMNADTGAYRSKLPMDSAHGTHEAFLIHPDDPGVERGWPENPLARISLKRFDSEDSDHTIFRPEDKAYGAGTSSFSSTVHAWAEKNHPANSGETYHKHDDLYDDSSQSTFKAMDDEDVHAMVDHIGTNVANLSPSHLELAMKRVVDEKNPAEQMKKIMNVSSHVTNLGTDHVHILGNLAHQAHANSVRDAAEAFRELAMTNGDKFSSNLIEKLRVSNAIAGKQDHALPRRIISNKKLPAAVVDKLPTNRLEEVHESALKPHHLDKMITALENQEGGSVYPIRNKRHMFNADQLHRLIKIPRDIGVAGLTKNKNFNESHTDAIMAGQNTSMKNNIISTAPGLKMSHLSHPLLSENVKRKNLALANPHISSEMGHEIASYLTSPQVLGVMKHNSVTVADGANKHFTDENVSDMVKWHSESGDRAFNQIRDKNLSMRMLHEYGSQIAVKEHDHRISSYNDDEEGMEKAESDLVNLHQSHEDQAEQHYDHFFSENSPEEKLDSPDFEDFAEHINKYHHDNLVDWSYPERLRHADY